MISIVVGMFSFTKTTELAESEEGAQRDRERESIIDHLSKPKKFNGNEKEVMKI